jgi:predicted helicase
MAGKLQGSLATDGELSLDDASKIVGCWNGLAKRAGTAPDGSTFSPGEIPMRRAVAFAKDIRASKQVAEMFPQVVTAYRTSSMNRRMRATVWRVRTAIYAARPTMSTALSTPCGAMRN